MRKLTAPMIKTLEVIAKNEPVEYGSYLAKSQPGSAVVGLIDRGLVEVRDHRTWHLTDAGRVLWPLLVAS